MFLNLVFQNDTRIFVPGTPRGNPDYIPVLQNLGLTVLVPLVVGQIIRFLFSDFVKKWAAKLRFPIINNIALLFLVWSVFCDGVASDAFSQMTGVDIVAIIFVDIFMYLFGCALCLWVARFPWPSKLMAEPAWIDKWRFSREDSVAIMVCILTCMYVIQRGPILTSCSKYCGSTKTVSMGIPLINVLYSESSYGVVGVLSLPLLMYHVLQYVLPQIIPIHLLTLSVNLRLFMGNFQVEFLKKWVLKHKQPSQSSAPSVHAREPSIESTCAKSPCKTQIPQLGPAGTRVSFSSRPDVYTVQAESSTKHDLTEEHVDGPGQNPVIITRP